MLLKRIGITSMLILMSWLILLCDTAIADDGDALRHEDPDSVEVYYDGIAILNYYTRILDQVLEKSPSEVKALQSKRPFANIPEGLNNSLEDFTDSSVIISELVVEIDSGLEEGSRLISQYQFEDIVSLQEKMAVKIDQAYSELWHIEGAVESAGVELSVPPTGDQEPLRRAYDEVEDRVEQLNNLLGFFQELLLALSVAELQDQLQPTEISLIAEPQTQFVGEEITVKGNLSSNGTPLSDRQIVILLDGIPSTRIQAKPDGSYAGSMQLPYKYVPAAELQAVYYPREGDRGIYQGSRSETITIDLQFYDCNLNLSMDGKAYPGMDAVIKGQFECDEDAPQISRDIELYLDGNLVRQTKAGVTFVESISLDPEIDIGTHRLMVIAPANGRYAPALSEIVFEVVRAVPIIDLSPPGLAIMPLALKLNGTVHTDRGPLGNTPIEASFGGHKTQAVTSDDGSFSVKLDTGLNLSIVGSEELEITVYPEEPWASSASTSWSLIAVNSVSVGILGLVLIAVLIILVKRLVVWFVLRDTTPATAASLLSPMQPAWSALRKQNTPEKKSDKKGLGNRVLEIYAKLVKRTQSLTGIVLSPGMTFREFSVRCGPLLGPGQAYLDRFTRIVERVLYSKHSTSFTDWDESQELNQMVEKSISYEGA